MTNDSFDYKQYLASREWSLLREQVRERSGNTCEHCFTNPQQAVHHLTYERTGHEDLDDLMAICNECHEFLSGKSNTSPLSDFGVVSERLITSVLPKERWGHYIVPYSTEAGPRQLAHAWCRGSGCLWCKYADRIWGLFLFNAVMPPREPRR